MHTEKPSVKYRVSLHTLPPPLSTAPAGGTFVAISELVLTHHHQPKSRLYIKVHSWCCSFYEFGKIGPPLWCHTGQYHFLKIFCAPPVYSSPPQPLATTEFCSLHSFSFCRMSHSWQYTVCSLLKMASFT